MSAVTRKQIAQAFRKAKPYLWDGGQTWIGTTPYICWAIEDNRAGDRAREIVMARLDGHVTVEDWLRYGVKVEQQHLTDTNLQAHRHAWLDQLIAEFEAPAAQAKE